MSSDDGYLDWRDNDDLDSGDDQYSPSGNDDDEFGLQGISGHDAFDEPKCPECHDTNLHSSGSLSICLTCRSVQSSGAVVSTTDAFPYRPLVQDSELRLLLVWPPTDNHDPIHCSLIHGRLGLGIEYDAISYTWADDTGDDFPSTAVFINNLALPVTATCEAVLKRVRLKSTAKVLWIDAICINQADKNERGHQVRLMPDIYSHAKKVLIFPGEATDEDSRGLYYLPELEQILSRPTPAIGNGDQSERPPLDIWGTVRHALNHLLRRRYFTRVWILQEIALAKDPVVLYGVYEVPWNTIRTQITRSLERWAASATTSRWSRRPPQPLIYPDERLARALALGTTTVRGPSDLLDLLDKARSSQAHDPRDKVFALFGLIPFASRFGLIADYNQSVEEAYAKVAVLLVAQHGLLPILARTVGNGPRQANIAPWIPDWSTPGWGMADKSLPKGPNTAATDSKLLDRSAQVLLQCAEIPVVARPNDYEMDFIGARVCDLGALADTGLGGSIFSLTKGGIFHLTDSGNLDELCDALHLPIGTSFDCYLPLSPIDAPTYQDDEHLERELKNQRDDFPNARAADLLCGWFRQRHSKTHCELVLSSGRNGFCYAGLCILSQSVLNSILSAFYIRRHLQDSRHPHDPRRFLSRKLLYIVLSSLTHETEAWGSTVLVASIISARGILAKETREGRKETAAGSWTTVFRERNSSVEEWSDRELQFLNDLLQTSEGRAMLGDIERRSIWPEKTTPSGSRLEFMAGEIELLLGDDPVKVERLTFGLRGDSVTIAREAGEL